MLLIEINPDFINARTDKFYCVFLESRVFCRGYTNNPCLDRDGGAQGVGQMAGTPGAKEYEKAVALVFYGKQEGAAGRFTDVRHHADRALGNIFLAADLGAEFDSR